MSNLRRDQIVSKGLLLFLLSLDAALAFMATEFGAVLLFFFFFLDFVLLLLLLLLLLFDVFAIAEFFFFLVQETEIVEMEGSLVNLRV
jgi:hypothetical protein